MTRAKLLSLYAAVLADEYPWAADSEKLARFMASVERTISTEAKTWNHDSPAMVKAWKLAGGKGRPTLKALRAVPA